MRYLDRASPSALLILACAFWGAGTVLNKALLSLPPVTLLFVLLAPSAAALWAATLLTRAARTSVDGWPATALAPEGGRRLFALDQFAPARSNASAPITEQRPTAQER